MALKAVSAPLGSPVGGSGTPGTIPVWSGTGTTLGDSPLTVSGTTVTATQAFTVNGTQTFNGNLVSGFNQTWTLNGGFLNIQSGLLYLDKTNSRIGIGTASPASRLDVAGTITCDDAGTGLKLPATPGNGDASTIDCYQENPLASTAGNGWTPTLSAAATWGGTQPTVDYARYIRIGSLVFCEVRLSGAAISATYGSTTISQPPVTMNAFAYESAVSVSTGVGSGVGVCTSTSVLLPTLGATAVMRLSWFYFTTS